MAAWQISGEYMETCNCTLVCPCITTNMVGKPTEGDCKAALAMRIDKGDKDGVSLDGVKFLVVMRSPGPMIEGNLTVGLVIDSAASDAQVEAISAIASGGAGGPMAALAPLVGKMAGVERSPISFEIDGLNRTVRAGNFVDQACEGLPSAANPAEPICIDNTAHPISPRIALAKATRSVMHVFGIDWEDNTGTRNGHFWPFAWSG